MSTKSTIAHGDDYHLYDDVMDSFYDDDSAVRDRVWLQVVGAAFDCSSDGQVTLSLPAHVWRAVGAALAARMERAKPGFLAALGEEVGQQQEDHERSMAALRRLMPGEE